jgi:MFS family permease
MQNASDTSLQNQFETRALREMLSGNWSWNPLSLRLIQLWKLLRYLFNERFFDFNSGLLFASLLLGAGALGDRFGAKGTSMRSLLVFTASALCGMAPGIEAFQISRILQGTGAPLFQRIERGV